MVYVLNGKLRTQRAFHTWSEVFISIAKSIPGKYNYYLHSIGEGPEVQRG